MSKALNHRIHICLESIESITDEIQSSRTRDPENKLDVLHMHVGDFHSAARDGDPTDDIDERAWLDIALEMEREFWNYAQLFNEGEQWQLQHHFTELVQLLRAAQEFPITKPSTYR